LDNQRVIDEVDNDAEVKGGGNVLSKDEGKVKGEDIDAKSDEVSLVGSAEEPKYSDDETSESGQSVRTHNKAMDYKVDAQGLFHPDTLAGSTLGTPEQHNNQVEQEEIINDDGRSV
jgi:hypothetical protein